MSSNICLVFNYIIHEEKGSSTHRSQPSLHCEPLTFHDMLKWILIGYSLLTVVETVDMASGNFNQEFVFMKCESKPTSKVN